MRWVLNASGSMTRENGFVDRQFTPDGTLMPLADSPNFDRAMSKAQMVLDEAAEEVPNELETKQVWSKIRELTPEEVSDLEDRLKAFAAQIAADYGADVSIDLKSGSYYFSPEAGA